MPPTTPARGAGSAPRAAYPHFEDPDPGIFREDLLRPVFVAALGCVSAWAVLSAFTPPLRHLLGYQATAIAIIGACLWLVRHGSTRSAAALFSVSVWTLTQLPPFVTGHLSIPGTMLPLVSITAVGLIWSTRAALVLAPASALIWLAALWAKGQGWLPEPQPRSDLQFWFILTASLIMMVVFLHVATRALHKALAQARNNARQALRLMREAPDAILIVTREGTILAANPAVHRVTGFLPSRLLGGRLFLPGVLDDEDLCLLQDAFAAALAGEGGRPFEVELLRPDGTTATVETNCHPMEWDGHECLEVILRDITDRRRDERHRLSVVEETTQREKMEAVGQLAGGVAHDFNNLLTVVGGCADLIREDPDASPSVLELAEEIRSAQAEAARLTRRLLAFAQRQILDGRPMSVGGEVSYMQPVLATVAGHACDVTVSVPPVDTTVHFDPHQLEQILVNLVANARDASEGAGPIHVEVAAVTLDRPLPGAGEPALPGDYVVVSVRDRGHGIGPGVLPHIFDPFFSTRGPGRGSGLGLSAVLGIVRQVRGQITVETAPGSGSCFSVYLPRERPAAPADPQLSLRPTTA